MEQFKIELLIHRFRVRATGSRWQDPSGLRAYSGEVAQYDADRLVQAAPWPDQRMCGECGERYHVASRGEGGPFHFRAMRMDTGPGATVRITGHWRSGNWNPGETLELRRRDGYRLTIIGARMELAASEMSERRGQRTLLVPEHQSLQPGCIWAMPSIDGIE
ncbi:hypothetical protein GCM10010404_70510 [Nonomuraea africana]